MARLKQALRIARPHALADKLTFFRGCRDAGIPTPPVLMAIEGGVITYLDGNRRTVSSGHLLVKSMHSPNSQATQLWLAEDEDWTWNRDNLCAEELVQCLIDRSMNGALIVQRAVASHPELLGLDTGALPTVRVITALDERREPEPVAAALRLPMKVGPVNASSKGVELGTPIDLATGTLGAAFDPAKGSDGINYTHHPISGALIRGRLLPFWMETIAVAQHAHALFPEQTTIGWDVAILSSGPSLIDGNSFPTLDIHQRAKRQTAKTEKATSLTVWQTLRRPRRQRAAEALSSGTPST